MFVTHSELIRKRTSYEGSIALLFAAIVLVGGFTYSEMQQSNLLTQQIDDYAASEFPTADTDRKKQLKKYRVRQNASLTARRIEES